MDRLASAARWLFSSEQGAADRLIPRLLFLRALGFIYFSAFFSLIFQIRGLIGLKAFCQQSNTCKPSPMHSATPAACGSHQRCCGFRADRMR